MKRNLCIGLITLTLSSLAIADHPAVEQRQALFEQIDEETEMLEAFVDEENWPATAVLAQKLEQYVATLQTQFPPASKGEGRSDDDVWEQWGEFSGKLTQLETSYQTVHRAASSGNLTLLAEALEAATSSCRSCHMSYRSLW
ncbi:cytochrome c [Photobacterium sp. MCCC 1A19761]|uniref:c-type cytochrome n=1 Tax=Photobacterium sp. MCCC 1A19761 TaxID=3115000 RepID=UPI00307EE6E9